MYWHDIDIIIMKYWLVFKDKYWVTSKTQEEKFAVTPFRSSWTGGVLNVADLLGQHLLIVLVVPVIDEDAAGPEPTGATSHPFTLHVLALLAREANTFISLWWKYFRLICFTPSISLSFADWIGEVRLWFFFIMLGFSDYHGWLCCGKIWCSKLQRCSYFYRWLCFFPLMLWWSYFY